MVSLAPFLSYLNQNVLDYRSASVIPICDPEYVIWIRNLIDFGHDWLRMDQELPFTYDGKFCNQLTAPYLLWYIFLLNRTICSV